MKKRYLLLGGVLLLLIILAMVLLLITNAVKGGTSTQSATEQNKPSQETQNIIDNSKTVTLSANGFTPKEITIKTGTRIIWFNNREEKASVNSDPYPVNSYWKFLNLGSFDNGQRFSLIFDKPGAYSYHNQYKSEQTGTITVN